jgi:hypothetical protein
MGRLLVRLAQIDVLLLDDFAMASLKDKKRRDFLEICDDRHQRRSPDSDFADADRWTYVAHKVRTFASKNGLVSGREEQRRTNRWPRSKVGNATGRPSWQSMLKRKLLPEKPQQ